MKRFYHLIVTIVFCAGIAAGQEFDLTYSSAESGAQTHVARNSITLGPGYEYNPGGGSLTIGIQNPVVTGTVSYGTPVDPESRTLNTTSYLVGATNGSFSVNPMGGASYTIPLELLPGVNGLAPELSLVYASNEGPGIAGFGWQLAGLSVLSRGPNTYYHDGLSRGIEMDASDRLFLDGQRLINTYSTYGAQDALYQTENDVFTRISAMGGINNSQRWFKAETKSGLMFEYGNNTGSKQTITGLPSNIIKWYISKVSDLFGNSMNILYLNDHNCIYPADIIYGQNTISFYYKEKNEKDASYLKGMKIEQWYVLDKIIVKYNSIVVKTYEFKYNFLTSNYNNYTVLNEIIEYGTNAKRYNSTAITYQLPANVNFAQTTYNTTHESITYNSKLCAGDYNGDGKTDFFCLPDASKGATWTGRRAYFGDGNDNFTLYYSNSTPLVDLTQLKDIRSLDINGDGKDDILYETGTSSTSSFSYMLNEGTGFSLPQLINTQSPTYSYIGLSGKGYRCNLLMEDDNELTGTDYNGDGINDIFINDNLGNWIVKSLGNGSGGLTSSLNTLGSGNKPDINSSTASADFNGDGKADLWIFTSNGTLIILPFKGTDFGPYLCSVSLPYAVTLGDFNADGKADLFLYGSISGGTVTDMGNWQIWLSTGKDFEQYSIPKKKNNLKDDYLRLGDFNGDGATDLMVTSKNMSWTGTYFYITKNKGTDFYTHSLPAYPVANHNYYVADYNGDGINDFICTDGQAAWWNGYQVYKTIGNTSVLADKIGNGLGKLTKITYAKLSQASSGIYQRGTGAVFPVTDFQGPLAVVSSAQFDNGLSSMNTQAYYYEGAKLHLQGKGFLCFSKTKATDVTLGIENQTVNSYHTTYFYPQLVQTISKRSGSADTISKVTNTWTQKVLDATRKRILPYVQRTVQLDKLTGHSVTTVTGDYDNYGNASPITKTYSGGHTETSTVTYNNTVSSSQWLLGRPVTTVIQYSGFDTVFSRTVNRIFGPNNNNLARETLYPGTASEISHGYKYNSNGTLMRDSVIAGSTWRTSIYKYQPANGIRLEKITDPLSHSKEYTYLPTGRLQTEKDYLNNTITYQYDDFGRLISMSTSFGDQVTKFYNWESPTGLIRYYIQKEGNDGSVTKTCYDELSRQVKSDVKGFDGNFISTATEYNTKGQVYRISEPASTTAWNVYAYNNYGQITGITRPSGRNSTWVYNGASVTETVGGKNFIKTYSSQGYVLTATDNGGMINYSYLPNGKVKLITAPGNIKTWIKYDYADNQARLVDPSAGTITYAYNAFGELTSQTTARQNQNTTITYHKDGRINQKVTPEATTNYSYNNNKQLKRVKISTGVNRIYRYDTKGRMVSMCDSISNVKDSTTYSYDNLGKLLTVTHPSGIVETRHYNDKGYPDYVNVGSSTLWKINSMNSRLQVSTATYGNNLNLTCGYDSYGYPTSTTAVAGSATLQDFRYAFDPVSGNLSWRKDNLPARNIQENFAYDNLDRLKRVYRGTTTLLNMAYENSKGGITRKTDVGKFYYNTSLNRPYALSSMDSCSIITSSMNDSLTYTTFESVKTIKEGNYLADFTYNCDNQRAKMVVQQNTAPILTRWYMGNSYMKQNEGGVEKEFTYIGGNAYTAPVLGVTQGGTTTYYYLLRDHLANITHVINQSNSLIAEYSYDAWGRMRNPVTWVNYSPGSEPALFSGRGYTGHEHLPWFKLINMNGRLYDPLSAQFLSADKYIQAHYFTQSFNRYVYCFNNPLKYIDPTGWYAIPELKDDVSNGGETSRNNSSRYYDQPQTDIGLSSGQAWSVWNITPHIAAYKQYQYYYVGDGKYQNGLGEIVSFDEVYQNVLAPTFQYGYVRVDKFISATDGKTWEYKGYQFVYKPGPIIYVENDANSGKDGLLPPVDTKYPVTSPFTKGNRVIPELGLCGPHLGIDIGTPKGTPILSPWSGTVIMAQDTEYGLSVIVRHDYQYDGQNIQTGYAHLSEMNVNNGLTINRGDLIGYTGTWGTGPHLHFTLRIGVEKVNPNLLFPYK